ncbi:alpha/beta hydrolase [Cognatitamlana onchidii]|uniref:alpha/beta hydrolase n=1 Tax=Cognatitamlana onchidii TaxID=2562860 RepID=UPI0010A64C83|nr:alpha/beta hydrolase [Algibacter onchidii]
MRYLRITLILALCMFLYVGCSNTNDEEVIINRFDPSKSYASEALSYGPKTNQILDIFLPANRTTATKTLILVHGGGWTSGDKADMNFVKELIKQDFPDVAIANINYQLASTNRPPYPMQIDDITEAVQFLVANKEQYTISDTIGFIGISAGAHLSMLWSYAFDSNKQVEMVCSIVGPTNFTDPVYLNNTSPIIEPLIDLFGQTPTIQLLEKASPYHQVTSVAPPTIMFYAENDELVPISQGLDMRDKLATLGVPHEFTLYPNVGHGLGIGEILDVWAKLKIFITNKFL